MTEDQGPKRVIPPSKSPMADKPQRDPEPPEQTAQGDEAAAPRGNQNPDDMDAYDNDYVEALKARRRPLGQRQTKLTYPGRPGWKRRWVNDEPGRVQQAKDGGYRLVMENGEPVRQIVGTHRHGGGGMNGFLMEIPLELYNADQADKQSMIDVVDEQIYHGKLNEERDDHRYVPKGGIRISASR